MGKEALGSLARIAPAWLAAKPNSLEAVGCE